MSNNRGESTRRAVSGCYIGGVWHNNVQAYDRLPKPVRAAIRDANYKWSPATVWLMLYTTRNSKRRRWTVVEIVEHIRRLDAERAAKAYAAITLVQAERGGRLA